MEVNALRRKIEKYWGCGFWSLRIIFHWLTPSRHGMGAQGVLEIKGLCKPVTLVWMDLDEMTLDLNDLWYFWMDLDEVAPDLKDFRIFLGGRGEQFRTIQNPGSSNPKYGVLSSN
jgi:hypothetical protein